MANQNKAFDKSLEQLRNDIMTAANVYSVLAAHSYLYVFKDKFFELFFPTRCFRHLCGVSSTGKAEHFFRDAKAKRLAIKQIVFDRSKRQNIRGAKKKACNLKSLLSFVTHQVIILENLQTQTFTYRIGVTDLSITLGLEKDRNLNNLYFPRTLRNDDNDVDRSGQAEFADFVFEKELGLEDSKYDIVTFKNEDITPPTAIQHLVTYNLWNELNQRV